MNICTMYAQKHMNIVDITMREDQRKAKKNKKFQINNVQCVYKNSYLRVKMCKACKVSLWRDE